MTQLDCVQFLFELGNFGPHRVDLLDRYLLFTITQIQSLDIIELARETFIGRRRRPVRFRYVRRLKRRDC